MVVNCVTKMGRFIPVNTNVKTPTLARLFLEHLYWLYGLPRQTLLVIATLGSIDIFEEQYSIGWILK